MSWLSSFARSAKKWQPGKTLKKIAPTILTIGGGALLGPWGAALGSALGKVAQKGSKINLGQFLKAGASGGLGYLGGQQLGKVFGKALGRAPAIASGGGGVAGDVSGDALSQTIAQQTPVGGWAADAAKQAARVGLKSGGGWAAAFSGLSPMEKIQLASEGVGAVTDAYGSYQAGKMADKQFSMEEEERERERIREEQRLAAMRSAYESFNQGFKRYT